MEQKPPTFKDFLIVLPRMASFWLSLIGIVIGLVGGAWFLSEYLQTSRGGLVFGGVYSGVIGMLIVVYQCYQVYQSKTHVPAEQNQLKKVTTEHIIVTCPLFLGVLVAAYFLLTQQLGRTAITLWLAIAVWFVLRLTLRRRRAHSSERGAL
jgi:hypothetical protein